MGTIAVSIDRTGVLVCPDINAASGETLTWSFNSTLGSIISITATSGNVLSGAPQQKNGVWTATVGAGKAGQSETYTITVQPSAVGSGRITPPRGPRISIIAPIPEKN